MSQQNPAIEPNISPFPHGSDWVRADFHMHTKADKEFKYTGAENDFLAAYIEGLKSAKIGLGVIANHNKFNADEFKALRKRARKEGIGLLPGIELSVADGANGVHTLVTFSDDWLAGWLTATTTSISSSTSPSPAKRPRNTNKRTGAATTTC